MINRKFYGLFDEVTETSEELANSPIHTEPHIHDPHGIGMRLAGPAANQIELENVWIRLCRSCGLVYFEQLPNTLPAFNQNMGQVGQISR
jgi:hypothetical protein